MSEERQTALTVPESVLDLNAALAIQKAYLEACKALLDDSDYAIIRGEKFRKRSGWAKLRRAFAVTCQVVSERRIELDDDWGYSFVVRAELPTGRVEESDGACMASEFNGQRIAPTLANVRAKALTRAKSRATSDVLGAGIVSAEEIRSNDRHWIERPEARKRFWGWAKGTLGLTEDQVHEALGVESVYEFDGTMKDAKAILEEAAMGTAASEPAEMEF